MNTIDFKMPRYHEIPNVGLYLEQTVQYINQYIEPLHISITASMLSNYVKNGFVSRPIKKQYNADQIAHLMFIAIVKQTLSMQNIVDLFQLQEKTYDAPTAYDYFCTELENELQKVFENRPNTELTDMPFAKKTLFSVVIAISHTIYLNYCFEQMKNMK
ncbi:MAG: DUF1836 domain-containing protein [Eubacteriales bacterium]|nr:DUF1836 domain-containing protein [Eubacteriales bacterium]